MIEFIIIIGLPVAAFILWRKHLVQKRKLALRQEYINLIRMTCEEHAEALSIRRAQLITKDAYGLDIITKWEKERKYFTARVITPLIQARMDQATKSERALQVSFDPHLSVDLLIEQTVAKHDANRKPSAAIPIACSPHDFEKYCAEEISKIEGWNAQVTAKSGDQGVDVVAEYRGIKIAVQCKLYSQNIGNKAVQEALAGKAFIRAQKAVVVTNADFTHSARQLAKMSNVALLHVKQIDYYFSRLSTVIERKLDSAA